ncbi:MAG: GNAT family N-acetyltransferase [Balneolaceae bacterium]|nr:GNAT family N-acetyltransferase [Balneolaceae bacterium]
MGNRPNTYGVSIVSSNAERKQFLEFPYQHYEDDERWIAPLKIEQKKLIDTEKNPFFNNADMALFLAEQNGIACGRIAAIIDYRYNEYHGAKTGFFGFFECIDDTSAAKLLFKVAEDWLKERGMTALLGPANPSMMDEIGILIDGFEYDPSLLMPYNKPYYDRLMKAVGLTKEMDLYAFRVNQDTVAKDRMDRAATILRKRYPELSIRQVDMNELDREIEIVREIFNKAWADNWGFIPLTREELAAVAKDFKFILDPNFAHIVEMDGRPIAFSVALPDLNQALKHLDGRLFPFGIFKLLWYKRKISRVRTALMGVIPEYRGKGIDALLHRKAIVNGRKHGIYSSEMGWVLETNTNMIRVAERLGAHKEKTFRMYRKDL